jgi:aminoglycoside/choline kinase family phosphotransferase
MTSRADTIAAFLASHGFGRATRHPLAADASFRRYERLIGGPRTALLMDAPPPEDTFAFARIGALLTARGVRTPTILASDHAHGLLLVEDLGDTSLADRIDAEPARLSDAARVLAHLHAEAPPDWLPRWGSAEMTAAALGTICDWWWPASFGGPAPAEARLLLKDALTTMLAPLDRDPARIVHRDYFAGNLMLLQDDTLAVLDFQSAAIGHPAYDLASLIEDARRDMPDDAAEAATRAYLDARPELDPGAMRAALGVCAAQRHLRVAGQWVRLARRDGRPHYLAHGPRTWRLLERALTRPEAAPLAHALDRLIPPAYRTNPPETAA